MKLTEQQKKPIFEAITKKFNEHLKKGFTYDSIFTVVIPEMIAAAIEEYHDYEQSKTKEKAATETAKEVKLEIWDGANWGRRERSTN